MNFELKAQFEKETGHQEPILSTTTKNSFDDIAWMQWNVEHRKWLEDKLTPKYAQPKKVVKDDTYYQQELIELCGKLEDFINELRSQQYDFDIIIESPAKEKAYITNTAIKVTVRSLSRTITTKLI